MTTTFFTKLQARSEEIGSLLCVGLDPHEKELFPQNDGDGGNVAASQMTSAEKCAVALNWCKDLVQATLPYAACYKPNAAFFEALGDQGSETLRTLCTEHIPNNVPILLDVKRGDIGSTAAAYAAACYEHIGADAVTLSPLMGWDSVSPFVTDKFADKGAFVLCKTSNPGSNDFLALPMKQQKQQPGSSSSSTLLYEYIANKVGNEWAEKSNNTLGLVVGATDTVAMAKARKAAGDKVWILAPGVGAQGGNLVESLQAGLNTQGTGVLIPVSRGISRAADPAVAARDLQTQIQQARQSILQQEPNNDKKRPHDDISTTDNSSNIAPYQKEFLEFSLSLGVLKFGSFVLKSGRTSPYFFNAGLFASGAALHKLGNAYASTVMASSMVDANGSPCFDVLFGPAYKGISLGAVVSSALYGMFGVDVGFGYNRKEAKSHGEGGTLVGASLSGKRVLIVDDVITAGTAIRESHKMLLEAGAKPVGVVIALDRAEKRSLEDPVSAVQAVARDLGLPVISIVSLPQLQTFLERDVAKYGRETLGSVKKYRAEYGV